MATVRGREAWAAAGTGHDANDGVEPVYTQRGKVSYEDLEHSYLRLREDHQQLKKVCHEQEDKVRKLGTKLIRITRDLKRREADGITGAAGAGALAVRGQKRDVETEAMLDDLRSQVFRLGRQNEQLRNKLMYYKQLVSMKGAVPGHMRRAPGYDHVKSRIDAGSAATSQKRLVPALGKRTRPRVESDAGLSLDQLVSQFQLDVELSVSMSLPDQNRLLALAHRLYSRVSELEDRLAHASSHNQGSIGPSHAMAEADLLALQRDLKDKTAKLSLLQTRYEHVESSFVAVKENHARLLRETESLNRKLREEVARSNTLEQEASVARMAADAANDLKVIIDDLRKEKELLLKENRELIDSTFKEESDRERELREALKEAQHQLELHQSGQEEIHEAQAALAKQLAEKSSEAQKLREQRDALQSSVLEKQHETEQLQEKLAFFSAEGGVDLHELESALGVVRRRRERNGGAAEDTDPQAEANELAAVNAQLVADLDKTTHMLTMQERLTRETRAQVDVLQADLQRTRDEYERRLQGEANLLDQRAERIRKLERQLRDIVYNGGGSKAQRDALAALVDAPMDESVLDGVHLAEDETLLELRLQTLSLDPRYFAGTEPATFLTFDFFEHETVCTNLITGLRTDLATSVQFICRVDDFFLHYLYHRSMPIELNRSIGLDYEQRAVCHVSFRQIVDQSGRLQSVAQLVSSEDRVTIVGRLVYSIKLHNGVSRAAQAYLSRQPSSLPSPAKSAAAAAAPPPSKPLPGAKTVTPRKSALKSPGASRPSPRSVKLPLSSAALEAQRGSPDTPIVDKPPSSAGSATPRPPAVLPTPRSNAGSGGSSRSLPSAAAAASAVATPRSQPAIATPRSQPFDAATVTATPRSQPSAAAATDENNGNALAVSHRAAADVKAGDPADNVLIVRVSGGADFALAAGTKSPPQTQLRYSLYNAPAPHVSRVAEASRTPDWQDQFELAVKVTQQLEEWLWTQQLSIQVLDAASADEHTGRTIIGTALVPLAPLLENRPVQCAAADVRDGNGQSKGTLDVEVSWQQAYANSAAWAQMTATMTRPAQAYKAAAPAAAGAAGKPGARPSQEQTGRFVIAISDLEMDAAVLSKHGGAGIEALFLAFDFLGEMEDKLLPLPSPGTLPSLSMQTVFDLTDKAKSQALCRMMLDADAADLVFVLGYEKSEEPDELGSGVLDLHHAFTDITEVPGADVVSERIAIKSQDASGVVVAHITVSLRGCQYVRRLLDSA